jgi:hypothetical protein
MNRPEYCSSCGERQVEYGPEYPWGRSTYCPQCHEAPGQAEAEIKKEPKLSERQKALDALLVANKLLLAAETKKEADRYYKLLHVALRDYYNTVWESEKETDGREAG